ncbi:MAG: hypothetical protein ACLU30_05260 [Odoribacter splanchnicus]
MQSVVEGTITGLTLEVPLPVFSGLGRGYRFRFEGDRRSFRNEVQIDSVIGIGELL